MLYEVPSFEISIQYFPMSIYREVDIEIKINIPTGQGTQHFHVGWACNRSDDLCYVRCLLSDHALTTESISLSALTSLSGFHLD